MDEKTTVEPFAHSVATGRRTARGRRALAAGALLLVVGAAVSGCNDKSGSVTSGAAGAASSISPSASGAPSPSSLSPSPVTPGSPTTPGAPTPTPAPPTTLAPGSPTTPAAPVTPPENPIDPRGLLKPLSYLIDGSHLTVYFFGGVCDTYGLKADESKAGQVGVRVIITQHAPVGRMCPALAKREAVAADLSHPLQGRAVADLDTGADIPLATVPNGGPVSAGN